MDRAQVVQDLKKAFNDCRREEGRTVFTDHLWQQALALTKDQSPHSVAKELGITSSNLYDQIKKARKKKKSKLSSVQFIEATGLFPSPVKQVEIKLSLPNQRQCSVHWQASSDELLAFVKGLF